MGKEREKKRKREDTNMQSQILHIYVGHTCTENDRLAVTLQGEGELDYPMLSEEAWNMVFDVLRDDLKFNLSFMENQKRWQTLLCKKKFQFSVSFCTKRTIRFLNKKYRKVDKVTDVLSFALLEEQLSFASQMSTLDLGDILICLDQAKVQAKKFGILYETEIFHLLIHGFLHLLGEDHERSEEDEKNMQSREEALLRKIIFGLNHFEMQNENCDKEK